MSMPVNQKKAPLSRFPLRLMPSVRRAAANFSEREGVSLNQFINVAVAEKLAHLQHEEWVARRPRASESAIAKALQILDRSTGHLPAEEDRLPKGYVPVRRKYAGQKASRSAK